jgi:hypothetical protein
VCVAGAPHRRRLRRTEPDGEAILLRARELVAFGWCQGSDARDGTGAATEPWGERAVAWSLLGALVAAVDLPPEADALLLGPLRRALTALADVIDEPLLAIWNDDPARTQDDVLRTLDAARARLAPPASS